jgi:hypothetical protein
VVLSLSESSDLLVLVLFGVLAVEAGAAASVLVTGTPAGWLFDGSLLPADAPALAVSALLADWGLWLADGDGGGGAALLVLVLVRG